MYCNYCGKLIPEAAGFCAYCGRRVGGVGAPRRLLRAREGRKIAGVCLGFAEYLDLDVTLVRVLTLLIAIFLFPLGEIAYLAAWIVMPEAPLQLPAAASYPAPNPQG
jgi:phage shock protein C